MNLAVLACGLLAMTPDGGPTALRTKFKFDVPGALDEVDVPGMMKSSGVPLRIRAVRSKLKLPELVDHFTAAFEKEGLFIPPPGQISAPGPHVTGYDAEKGIAYSALFQTNLDRTITVVLSESYLHARRAPAPFAPVFPGSGEPLDAQTEGARSLQYTTSAHTKEIEAFYREVMAKAGCREVEPLAFACQGKLNRVWVRERPQKPTSVVVQQLEAAPGGSE